jgi:plastocyanin domain-containing protein
MKLIQGLAITLLLLSGAACAARDQAVHDSGVTRVALSVTEDGFVPAEVKVPAGKPVTLVVTRKTDRTCATELVMKDHQINQPLPLGKPVEITFTPDHAGTITYACGMDMYKGTIVVE